MGQQDRIERGAGAAGRDQALGDARAAVDEKGQPAREDQARRSEAVSVDLRTAGAEQRDQHGGIVARPRR